MKKLFIPHLIAISTLLVTVNLQAASVADQLCGATNDQNICLENQQVMLDKKITRQLIDISHLPKNSGPNMKALMASHTAWQTYISQYCTAYAGAFGTPGEQKIQFGFCYLDKSFAHSAELNDLADYYGEN